MVAAQVRDGGGKSHLTTTVATPSESSVGKSSDVYKALLAEVQSIACATLFAPVIRYEAVQAMGT